ncbi:MAG TPA: iron ABC transporter permease, partial [Ilumatobacteraceae bacterium]|nr:iron ABC transporter permease [Ilumatobacteraceae bacterium]
DVVARPRSPGAEKVPGAEVPARGLRARRRRLTLLSAGLFVAAGLLVLVLFFSVSYGSKEIPFRDVIRSFTDYDPTSNNHLIIRTLRIPRTAVGLMVGACLGLSGAVMQGLSRNPLADPGLLGVDAGAALFVVLGISVFGVSSLYSYVWFAFAGAFAASVVVYALGSAGRTGATPVKIALAGAALTALLSSFTSGILVLDASTLDQFRFWAVGSLAGRTSSLAWQMLPFAIVATVASLFTARTLNSLAMGEDTAKSLGLNINRARGLCALAIVLTAGTATAAAGPIGFIGLTIPHVVRKSTGPDHRWLLPYCALLGPILLLGSDVIGRVVDRPAEVQVGIITALIGAPFFIYLVRRTRLAQL